MNEKSLVTKVANKYGIEPEKLLHSLKATAFKTKDGVTNEQMLALLVVADQYGLNPWTKEIYAYPDKSSGIVPVVGVDGWSRIINQHPQFDGVDFNWAHDMSHPEGGKFCPEWCEAVIHRKDRSHPTVVREYLDEVYRAPFEGKYGTVTGPWQSHTKRMLRHKALIQAARIAMGFVGIFDEDEADRIREAHAVEVKVEHETRPTLPELGEKEFMANIGEWQAQISKGMDPEDLMAMLETRWSFSEGQRAAVLNTVTTEEAEEVE